MRRSCNSKLEWSLAINEYFVHCWLMDEKGVLQ